ncbi:tRNA preQ1(34) S-adenosylmethionine ribosyltransferase-isomerase QueA [Dongia sp.]|uniref:tRNA preQ1(34) S-adenosylmethionine ribosyltransferase-isomerase QueA n=1 Tax=Dongia sp. TaxID=1977262 RepID=UPI0035AEDD8F
MRLSDFDFDLPPDRIALHPVEPRDAARLLHVQGHGLSDRIVRDLPDLLREGDVLVSNDTKVIPAQLEGRRGEARIEVTLLTEVPAQNSDKNTVNWWAFARPGKKLRLGEEVAFAPDFRAIVREKAEDGQVRLDFGTDEPTFGANLARHGWMPLPPYIRKSRAVERRDDADYQTIFAAREGAVAAPTAGLHFTPDLLALLTAKGIEQQRVTLHVGAGTFLPVKVDDVAAHKMHAEYGEVSAATAEAVNRARADGRRIVAVGTTSLRLLESAARAGRLLPFADSTDIFITPGFKFQIVDLLMTNFHLPKSTLFMLVSAFAGRERMKAAYAHAIAEGYRFFSYGDASLLERDA